MAREAWTDERLDDLKDQIVRLDVDIRDLRRMMFQGFIAMATITITCFVGLAGLIAF